MKISIITPVLNAADTIEEAIQCVLREGDDVEHVVIDGGSTDGTLDILARHPHLVCRSEPGLGQSESMNLGFTLAAGEIISYLNADDGYEPGAFEEARSRFAEDPGLMFLVGGLRVIEQDKPERISVPNIEFEKMLRFFDQDFIPLNPASYFYRREVQEAVGGFDPAHPYAMDYRFLLDAALKFEFKRTDKVLGWYRIHPATKTGRTASCRDTWKKTRFSRAYRRHLSWWGRARANLWYMTEGHHIPRRLIGKVAGKIRTILKY